MKTSLRLIALSATLLVAPILNAYILEEGETRFATSLSQTTFDNFWAGDVEQNTVPGGGEIERLSYRVYLEHGVTSDVTVDASIGYADVESGLSTQKDFTDILLGARMMFMRQQEDGYDLAVRAGLIIAGKYDVGELSAPGDGENGLEFSVKAGTQIDDSGLRVDGELGYTFKDGDVPDAFSFRAGPSMPLGNGFGVDASYIYFTGIDGIDIGGAGFTGLHDLPKVEEEGQAGEIGISYGTDWGYFRLSYSKIFDGRNIGEEETIGIYGSWGF